MTRIINMIVLKAITFFWLPVCDPANDNWIWKQLWVSCCKSGVKAFAEVLRIRSSCCKSVTKHHGQTRFATIIASFSFLRPQLLVHIIVLTRLSFGARAEAGTMHVTLGRGMHWHAARTGTLYSRFTGLTRPSYSGDNRFSDSCERWG